MWTGMGLRLSGPRFGLARVDPLFMKCAGYLDGTREFAFWQLTRLR